MLSHQILLVINRNLSKICSSLIIFFISRCKTYLWIKALQIERTHTDAITTATLDSNHCINCKNNKCNTLKTCIFGKTRVFYIIPLGTYRKLVSSPSSNNNFLAHVCKRCITATSFFQQPLTLKTHATIRIKILSQYMCFDTELNQ